MRGAEPPFATLDFPRGASQFRAMSLPRAPATLSGDFAEALGHAVAGFGFLEEVLKHAIHALSLDRLGDSPTEAEIDGWAARMEQIRGDSLGTLIDSFLAACDRCGTRRDMRAELQAIRDRRNMLCHASWKPVPEAEGGGWRPAFVTSREIAVPARMAAADLRHIRAETLVAVRRITAIARASGLGDLEGADPARIEAERARARARAARKAAEQRRPPAWHPPDDEERGGARHAAHHWHPLDADEAAREARAEGHNSRGSHGRPRHHPDPRRERQDPEERRR